MAWCMSIKNSGVILSCRFWRRTTLCSTSTFPCCWKSIPTWSYWCLLAMPTWSVLTFNRKSPLSAANTAPPKSPSELQPRQQPLQPPSRERQHFHQAPPWPNSTNQMGLSLSITRKAIPVTSVAVWRKTRPVSVVKLIFRIGLPYLTPIQSSACPSFQSWRHL